jgi:hypothetical protein
LSPSSGGKRLGATPNAVWPTAKLEEIYMASLHRPSLSVGWLGLIALAVMGGCAPAPPNPAEPGELEMRVEAAASYGVVGRFHLVGVEPGAPSRDIGFDAATSRLRTQVPPGAYVLTLEAGATLVCRGDEDVLGGSTAPPVRFVSISPQILSIASGEVTTARIGFGSAPIASSGTVRVAKVPMPRDPCGEVASAPGEQALSRR